MKSELKICRPKWSDLEAIENLFFKTVQTTFAEEQIPDPNQTSFKQEVQALQDQIKVTLSRTNSPNFYWIAKVADLVVGTIAYGIPSRIITEHLAEWDGQAPEIKSVYILPEFQGQGIGTTLFQTIQERLEEEGIRAFCLDSGYKQAQLYWQRRLGAPTRVLPDYWGEGSDHWMWWRQV